MISEQTQSRLMQSYLLNTYGTGSLEPANDFDFDWAYFRKCAFVSMAVISFVAYLVG